MMWHPNLTHHVTWRNIFWTFFTLKNITSHRLHTLHHNSLTLQEQRSYLAAATAKQSSRSTVKTSPLKILPAKKVSAEEGLLNSSDRKTVIEILGRWDEKVLRLLLYISSFPIFSCYLCQYCIVLPILLNYLSQSCYFSPACLFLSSSTPPLPSSC